MSAGVALGDELCIALAHMRDAPLPSEPPSRALDTDPAAEVEFEVMCGAARVALPSGESIVIGRAGSRQASAENFVGVDHRLVSRRHVAIRSDGGELVAEDLGSRNGTTLWRGASSTPLVGPTVLVAGDRLGTVDEIELGRVVARIPPASGQHR